MSSVGPWQWPLLLGISGCIAVLGAVGIASGRRDVAPVCFVISGLIIMLFLACKPKRRPPLNWQGVIGISLILVPLVLWIYPSLTTRGGVTVREIALSAGLLTAGAVSLRYSFSTKKPARIQKCRGCGVQLPHDYAFTVCPKCLREREQRAESLEMQFNALYKNDAES